jgi:hypothetical protein
MAEDRKITWFELVIISAIIGFAGLFTYFYFALDPSSRLEDIRNSKRMSDVVQIIDAVKLSQFENSGFYPDIIEFLDENTVYQIGIGNDCNDPCFYPTVSLEKDCLDLTGIIGKKISDPKTSKEKENHSGYYLVKYSNGSLGLGVCNEEQGRSLLDEPEEILVVR